MSASVGEDKKEPFKIKWCLISLSALVENLLAILLFVVDTHFSRGSLRGLFSSGGMYEEERILSSCSFCSGIWLLL